MVCQSCGSGNAETARFCGSCGTRLTASCPSCRADVPVGLRFCNACGSQIPDGDRRGRPGEAGPEAGPQSERRLVSVLFVDLEDFTGLTENLDPEDVRNLQARYFEVARSVVAHYGGTIEKFIGDAVMAVWGAPIAHEDDAERAVRAALELVAAVGKLRGAVPGRRLSARAAVCTGEAAVTLGAEGQGMVAGDLVNTSARLQAAAPSNTVLVDDTTRRVVGDPVTFEPALIEALKGKSRAVDTWRAVGLAGERPKGRAAGHSGPFIGRDAQLGELVDLYARCVAERRSRIVSVLGIAGIGKSRLLWEFERHLEALPEVLALHVGRAPAYGEGITFAPVAEMVRRRARINEGTETELARRQLKRTLDEFVPDDVDRRWIEPRLATLLDPGSHAAFERDELFAAWRRFFERVSDWAPVLLVFEDLQWADAALLDFIDHVATWSRAFPIFILTLARPELLDKRPTWGTGHHSFTAIQLEPLRDDQMGELLLGLGPDLPAPSGPADRRAGRRRAAVWRRGPADAGRPRPGAGRRAGLRDPRSGGPDADPGDAPLARVRAHRRPATGRAWPSPVRVGPGEPVPARSPGRDQPAGDGRGAGAHRGAHAPGARDPRRRASFAGSGPARVRAGSRPRRGLQHRLATRPANATCRGGGLPRGPWRRGARGGGRRAPARRPRRGADACGSARRGAPGGRRAAAGSRAGVRAARTGPGPDPPRARGRPGP